MTAAEIHAWEQALSPDPRVRKRLLVDLLEHASGDRMAAADYVLCREAYARLTGKAWPHLHTRTRLSYGTGHQPKHVYQRQYYVEHRAKLLEQGRLWRQQRQAERQAALSDAPMTP